MEQHSVVKNISSAYCSHCHAESDGFKRPMCGKLSAVYDTDHWRKLAQEERCV